jgi:hypothetical protein
MSKRWVLGWLLVIAAWVPVAVAAEPQTIPVRVQHAGEDMVGQRFAYQLREAVRGSKAYRLDQSADAMFTIHLVTLDPDDEAEVRNSRTIAAITMTMSNLVPFERGNPQTWLPIYMNSSVLIVGSGKLESMAQSVLADFDVAVEAVKQQYGDRD